MRKEKPSQSCWASLRTVAPGGLCGSCYFTSSKCCVAVSMFTTIIRVIEIGAPANSTMFSNLPLPLFIVTWPVASASFGRIA